MSKSSVNKTLADIRKVQKHLKTFIKAAEVVPLEVLKEEVPKMYAEEIAAVPYRTGALENSVYCRVFKTKKTNGLITGAKATSSTGFDYAVPQHENIGYIHPIKGKAFYIRDPFYRGVSRIEKKISRKMRYKV